MDIHLTPTFAEARDQFLAIREGKVRSSTARHDRSALNHFTPLSRKRIADISPDLVQSIIDRIKAPTTRDEAIQRFSSLMRYLERRGDIQHWPYERLQGRRKPVYRERVLSIAELVKILTSARIWALRGDQYGVIVEILALTAQRRQQIGSLEASHVDFAAGVIEWPASLMKARKKHVLPLTTRVRTLLPQRTCFMFPNKHRQPFTFCSVFDRQFRDKCGVVDWTLHDLRRSAITHMASPPLSVAPHVLERIAAHASGEISGIAAIYNRATYICEMRDALERWERQITDSLRSKRG
jgi:integrase